MRISCPNCYAEFALEAALDDEAARELMGVLASLERDVARPLTAYLGLFRPRSRRLSWDRALRLVREVQQLPADSDQLAIALAETVEAMRKKQEAGQWKPLGNHNYLKSVLETVEARPAANVERAESAAPAAGRPTSRTVQGLSHLEERRRG